MQRASRVPGRERAPYCRIDRHNRSSQQIVTTDRPRSSSGFANLPTTIAYAAASAASLPWIVAPAAACLRLRNSLPLDDAPIPDAAPPPLVSVVVPARNEARNIAGCLDALAASRYPALEVTVVNDHSSDATAAIARSIAERDPRVRVLGTPPLPSGWFGKQWACQTGARTAAGDVLLFVDADARVAPDLIRRSVLTMQREHADLLSVAGRQEMVTVWEKLIQPQVFAVLTQRYGGTETVNRSRRTIDKIANGQFLMIRRETYDALGGHALVRSYVAEDLMLAQKYFASGRRTVIRLALDLLSTRMYTSLGELVRGWGKNVYAGGREAVPGGRAGRLLFPFVLLIPPLAQLVPLAVLALGAVGIVSGPLTLWAATATATQLAWWIVVYRVSGVGARYALLFPAGAALLLYIFVTALARGSRVGWKGREYLSGPPEEPHAG